MLNLKELSLPVGIGMILGVVVATYVSPETDEGYAVLILLFGLVSYVVWQIAALVLKGFRKHS